MQAQILIIDDEEAIRFSLRGILEDEGHSVIEASTGEEGLDKIAENLPDMIFLDIWLPNQDGLQILEQIHAQHPSLPVIMISGHGTIETAVNAIKLGAHDFIEKPLSLEKVNFAAKRALEFSFLKQENESLKKAQSESKRPVLGTSQAIQSIQAQISRVAPTDAWVLITGENGTGKELAAHAIHEQSKRADRTLIAVNCAAIPEELIESELFGHEKGSFTGADQAKTGKFELAHKSTLFLDEIGDMSLKTQAKILRILQEQQFERVGGNRTITVNVRVIAATNKNLEEAIKKGEFREDLYYRLKVFPIALPALRERNGDITLLLAEFCKTLANEYNMPSVEFTNEALQALLFYSWPGNVRELKNFAERMLILYAGKKIEKNMLPPEISAAADNKTIIVTTGENSGSNLFASPDFKTARTNFEAEYLAHQLQECDGNIAKLAERIGLERSYLYRKLKNVTIQEEE